MKRHEKDSDSIEYRYIVRNEFNRLFNRFIEKVIFTTILIMGLIMIIVAKFLEDGYWQSLLLDLGSSFASFVFLFWIFQYFLGRQPGNTEQLQEGILDYEYTTTSNKRRKGPTLKEDDQASIMLGNKEI